MTINLNTAIATSVRIACAKTLQGLLIQWIRLLLYATDHPVRVSRNPEISSVPETWEPDHNLARYSFAEDVDDQADDKVFLPWLIGILRG